VTIRAVVTVALAAALLAASLPAVDESRVQHADARVAGEVERLGSVARSLETGDDLVRGDGQPAQRRVTLHLPVTSWGASEVREVRIPPPDAGTDVVWQVEGGERHRRQLDGVSRAGPPDGLVVRDGGRQRLQLELRQLAGRRMVVVSRPPAAGG
jgi:hypothetical protein